MRTTILILALLLACSGVAMGAVTANPDTTASNWLLSSNNGTYATARNAVTASGQSFFAYYRVGQLGGSTGGTWDYIYRSFLAIPIPTFSGQTLAAATLTINGNDDQSATDFNINLYTSTHGPLLTVEDFDQFDGWQASGAYTGTVLNDTFSTSSYSADAMVITLNAAGLAAITAAENDTLWVAVLSSLDVSSTEPAGDGLEYIQFEKVGNPPILTLTLASAGSSRSTLVSSGRPTPLLSNGSPTPLKRP